MTDSNTSENVVDAILALCQEKIGYSFNDLSLLEAALTHASGAQHRLASNERLEFLGDAILGAIVCETLYEQYPNLLEGELTKIKSIVVSRRTCAQVSKRLGLEDCLILGKGMAADPNVPQSLLSNVFESLLAAIYLDGGVDSAQEFVNKNICKEIEKAASGDAGVNYKSILQQEAQRREGLTPTYQLLDEKGPDHSKCFKMSAIIGKTQFTPAWGNSKKAAEQRAAHNAISEINDEQTPYPAE